MSGMKNLLGDTPYPPPGAPDFQGADYRARRDRAGLANQMAAIFDLTKDGSWRTLQSIADITHAPQASVSAQLRNLRKARFGAHVVERRRAPDGIYEYRLILNQRKPYYAR